MHKPISCDTCWAEDSPDNRCEICPLPRACGFYCRDHHKDICIDGKAPKDVVCQLPPPGWYCQRKPVPHDGPCAALPFYKDEPHTIDTAAGIIASDLYGGLEPYDAWAPRIATAIRAWQKKDRGESLPDDIRAAGWVVAVHNDYRLDGVAHTFWLFTKGDQCVKGEGKTDAEALNQIRNKLAETKPR